MMKAKSVCAPYLVWMTVFILVPTALVFYFALTDRNGAFTLANLEAAGQYSNVFLRSIWLGAAATAVCLLAGYPLALTLAHLPAKRQNVMVMLVMLPMWMNFLLRTYAWMTILEDSGLINRALVFFFDTASN